MPKQFLSIWFESLSTDWFCNRDPSLRKRPFVLSMASHGRKVVSALNTVAATQGLHKGMAIADARALIPSLDVKDDLPNLNEKLLQRFAQWSIRFTPVVTIDPEDGLILEITGCSHLWGGDLPYLQEIIRKIKALGYQVRTAIANTIGAAWALAHYSKQSATIEQDLYAEQMMCLPPASLRLEPSMIERLHKLGLKQIRDILHMPRPALKRRFGDAFMKRLNQVFGIEEEIIVPIIPVEIFEERLSSMEPIRTRKGIEVALQRLLETLCRRLTHEQKGLRKALFTCYREDGKTAGISINTNSPSHHTKHLFKLFENDISTISPGSGIEVFSLTASHVEDLPSAQEKIWEASGGGLKDQRVSELYDRLSANKEVIAIYRYLPAEHHLPEKSFKTADSLTEETAQTWKSDPPRPLYLLSPPEQIEVTAPIPDYPPMFFVYKDKRHKIVKADGPERIEQEWWIQRGRHRDYYAVEDEEGKRYWLFRSGHYDEEKTYKWFIHGFFS
jgi:protein ImuB